MLIDAKKWTAIAGAKARSRSRNGKRAVPSPSDLGMVDFLKAPARTRTSATRRALVGIDVLTAGSGLSLERLDVGLKLIRSVGPILAARALEDAFDDAIDRRKDGALGPLALAMNAIGHQRSTEALLRAFAGSTNGFVTKVHAALLTRNRNQLDAYPELIAALPAERRGSLGVD